MSTVSIRQAGPQDAAALGEIFDAYRRFYGFGGDVDVARAYLHDRLARGESTVFIADTDDVSPAGFTQLYPTFCSVTAAPIQVLYDLFVDPAARCQGVGRALLERARAFAAEQGADRLELKTATDNHAAQALYESAGWERDDRFLNYEIPAR